MVIVAPGVTDASVASAAAVPRLRRGEHAVQQVAVPSAGRQSRLTALFKTMVIDWLKMARSRRRPASGG